MDLIRALYNSYNYAQAHGKVDKHDGNTVLLPLFHNSLRSTGTNVVEIELTTNGKLFDASFVEKDQYLVFPVTYNSSTRSGRMPPPHPLMDKAVYLVPSDLEHYKLYREEFTKWRESVDKKIVVEFLSLIEQYTLLDGWFDEVLSKLFDNYERQGFDIKYSIDDKEKKIDFSSVYFTFKIVNFSEGRDVNVTTFVELHNSYIEYVQSNLVYDGICNISGERDFISRKHRGLFGNSRLISVSNNTETYRGRFDSGDDIFNLGFITSEKAHLMLRYLTENPSSIRFLGNDQYLINWFSDDIENETRIDITNPNEDYKNSKYRKIVSVQNKDVGSSFIKGEIRFNKNAQYYILLLDKSSAGRVSIKYFKSLPVSELLEKLKEWNSRYNWPTYIEEKDGLINKVPSFYNILVSTYGVERNEKLVVSNENFMKDQLQKMISAMIDGTELPNNIQKNLSKNIRLRNHYDKTWGQLKRVALSILRNDREKRYDNMLDKNNMNRSYLYGRLLAIYEQIEKATYTGRKESNDYRLTNAEKLWTAYVNNPARTQVNLERTVQVYLNKLSKDENKVGLAVKYKKAKSEIIEVLSKQYDDNSKELMNPLEFDFIFGYEGQKSELFKSKENKEEEE